MWYGRKVGKHPLQTLNQRNQALFNKSSVSLEQWSAIM